MSVVVELTLEAEEFALGSALVAEPGLHVELERVVLASEGILPFVWVEGDDLTRFERHANDSPHVEDLVPLDRHGSRGLYRVCWGAEVEGFVGGLVETGATVLSGRGGEEWLFRLRFNDHADLASFHQYVTNRGLEVELDQVRGEPGGNSNPLSEPQREAVQLAFERGYFAVPRGTTLTELSAELGVSEQAVSERLRRGTHAVLDLFLPDE